MFVAVEAKWESSNLWGCDEVGPIPPGGTKHFKRLVYVRL
jgi:hypothetical protein